MIYLTIRGFLRAALLFVMCCVVLSDYTWAREKSDIVWLQNGDRITGEIKDLKRGKIRIKTDYMSEVYVEWENVVRISSNFAFQFAASDGERVTGTIGGTNDDGELIVQTKGGDAELDYPDIVQIAEMGGGFLNELQGNVSLGYSFTKASEIAQANLGFRVTHRTEKRSFTLNGSSIVTDDTAAESTQRSDMQFTATRFRPNRWFYTAIAGLESNDELQLKLRTRLGAGVGRFLFQTDKSEFGLTGGLIATNEQFQTDAPEENNAEGLLAIEYARYIFDDPVVDLRGTLSVYPSITQSGRTRAQLDVSLRWEMISNVYWDLTMYDTYDSDPSSGTANNNDYGVVTSLAYSF